jgi:hypothetical protein
MDGQRFAFVPVCRAAQEQIDLARGLSLSSRTKSHCNRKRTSREVLLLLVVYGRESAWISIFNKLLLGEAFTQVGTARPRRAGHSVRSRTRDFKLPDSRLRGNDSGDRRS